MLGTLYDVDGAVERDEFSGEIYRFVKIKQDEPWFDANTGKPASDEVVETIHIPPHLLPHLQVLPFVFYPKTHELRYVCKERSNSLGPAVVQRFLQNLFDHTVALKNYPRVAVTVLPEKGAVDELLAWPTLSRITMHFKRPNADDGHGTEQRFMELMEEQNLSGMMHELIGNDEAGITPNQDTRSEAKAAAKNGSVTVQGVKPDGTKGQESTIDKPIRLRRKFNAVLESMMDVLRRTKYEH